MLDMGLGLQLPRKAKPLIKHRATGMDGEICIKASSR